MNKDVYKRNLIRRQTSILMATAAAKSDKMRLRFDSLPERVYGVRACEHSAALRSFSTRRHCLTESDIYELKVRAAICHSATRGQSLRRVAI